MLLHIHRWLPHSRELAAPVPGMVERREMQFFCIALLGFYPHVLNKRRTCFK